MSHENFSFTKSWFYIKEKNQFDPAHRTDATQTAGLCLAGTHQRWDGEHLDGQVGDGKLTVVVVCHVVTLQAFIFLPAGGGQRETDVWECNGRAGGPLTMVGTVKN